MFSTSQIHGVFNMVKKILITVGVIFVVIPVLLIAGTMLMPEKETDWRDNITGKIEAPKVEETPPAPKTRKERIESLFSKYDGSFRPLERIVQKSMNDPDSYEHVETKYIDKDDHLLVVMHYRGNNQLGAKVLESIGAKYHLESEQIELITE